MVQRWRKTIIHTAEGNPVEGIAPLIISASRATDIPAFHAQWFADQLKQGYVWWKNPFNAAASQYVSFEKVRVVVFWTKNAAPLIPYLSLLEERGIHYYFQYTLNDYEAEGFEPLVPPLADRLTTFKKLSDRIGKERVIWRFDPLILSANLSVGNLLDRIRQMGKELVPYTDKLVFSFVDISCYSRVRRNLERWSVRNRAEGIVLREFTYQQKEEFAEGIRQMIQEWHKENPAFMVATCAEDISLEQYGIAHNKCIDDDLMIRLFPDDSELMTFLGCQSELFGMGEDRRTPAEKKKLKDRNQRMLCGCICSKDIGRYNTCGHACVYCYANGYL